jgi:hypothetical protein
MGRVGLEWTGAESAVVYDDSNARRGPGWGMDLVGSGGWMVQLLEELKTARRGGIGGLANGGSGCG